MTNNSRHVTTYFNSVLKIHKQFFIYNDIVYCAIVHSFDFNLQQLLLLADILITYEILMKCYL